jgi:uncharacterized iron-regulated protein
MSLSRPALGVFLAVLVTSAGASRAAAPPPKFRAVLRKLEQQISAARGLAFKKPVAARFIARPAGAVQGAQGYYSLKDKVLYVYDDVRDNYRRGVLIHEMVHALQDQHFGLAKLHAASYGSEAELAMAALVEGDATYTMIKVLEKEQPRVARMLDAPLEKADNLENAFLYAQGARYVQALHRSGGWAAVNARYALQRPRTTAAILHPEGAPTIDLGPGRSHGEFGIIRLLASHARTRPDAVRAAAGWRGDREIEAANGRAWLIAFAGTEQAKSFERALVRLRTAEGKRRPVVREPGRTEWRTRRGLRAVLRRGSRVLELTARDRKALDTLRDMVERPTLEIWSARDKRRLAFDELIDQLLKADIVCVGEKHDSDLHHRVQLQIIKALYARDPRLGVGMEMFQRPFQTALDRYLSGGDEETFLKDSEYRKRWGYDWSLYRPIVRFCLRKKVPVAALNLPDELRARIRQVGYDGLTADEKARVGPVDFHVKAHRAHHFESLAKMHGQAKVSAKTKERFYQVMTVWDDYMADSAARFQKERALRRLVLLAGSGHFLHGFGIPDRAAKRTGGKAVTVRVEVGGELEKLTAAPAADFVVVVR